MPHFFFFPGKKYFFYNGAECSLCFKKPHTPWVSQVMSDMNEQQENKCKTLVQFKYFKSHTPFLLTCHNICHSKSVLEKLFAVCLFFFKHFQFHQHYFQQACCKNHDACMHNQRTLEGDSQSFSHVKKIYYIFCYLEKLTIHSTFL